MEPPPAPTPHITPSSWALAVHPLPRWQPVGLTAQRGRTASEGARIVTLALRPLEVPCPPPLAQSRYRFACQRRRDLAAPSPTPLAGAEPSLAHSARWPRGGRTDCEARVSGDQGSRCLPREEADASTRSRRRLCVKCHAGRSPGSCSRRWAWWLCPGAGCAWAWLQVRLVSASSWLLLSSGHVGAELVAVLGSRAVGRGRRVCHGHHQEDPSSTGPRKLHSGAQQYR